MAIILTVYGMIVLKAVKKQPTLPPKANPRLSHHISVILAQARSIDELINVSGVLQHRYRKSHNISVVCKRQQIGYKSANHCKK